MTEKKIILRDYQNESIEKLNSAFSKFDSVLLQMPTGTGKTTVFSQFIVQHLNSGEDNRVLILVHRKELVEQISNRLRQFGLDSGIIMSGHEANYDIRVQIASVQSLSRRSEIPWSISLIVVDETHHIKARTYMAILKMYKEYPFKLLGVTATPIRTNGEGFSDVFDMLVSSYSIPKFISLNYLAKMRHLAVSDINLEGVSISNYSKDYNTLRFLDNLSISSLMLFWIIFPY